MSVQWPEAIVSTALPSLVEQLKASPNGGKWKKLFAAAAADAQIPDTRIAEATLNSSAGGAWFEADSPFRSTAALLNRVGDPDKTEPIKKLVVLQEQQRLATLKQRYVTSAEKNSYAGRAALDPVVSRIEQAEKLLLDLFPEYSKPA